MKNSIERIRAVMNGELPDRAPMFDLLRNTAVIEHFTGETLTVENGAELVYKAYAPAIDGTRPLVKYPNPERTVILPDGRKQEHFRWTIWTEHRRFADSEAYAREKRGWAAGFDPAWTAEHRRGQEAELAGIADMRRKLGDVFLFPCIPSGPCLMGLYGEVGLEDFSYFLADCPEVIVEQMEMNTVQAENWYRNLPEGHGIEVGFLGDDIAFKSGPLLNPEWMREHYFPRLARTLGAAHQRGIKVLFHSDGNLNPILDDLVAAGIDGLNPIEVLAGMDVGEIHRRYPHLFMAGGIDVSQLLPFGTPGQVRDAVRKAIDEAGGRILVDSSTELNEDVPLANFLALREAVLE
ncbi:MAG: uroporphyrinogen decarboxylase family protein [bacterium]